MLIGELSGKSGMTKDAIRHYMSEGLLKPTQRSAGTRTYNEFSDDDLIRLDYISLSKTLGFTLKELKTYIDPYLENTLTEEDIRTIFETKLQQIEIKIAGLQDIKSKLKEKMKSMP